MKKPPKVVYICPEYYMGLQDPPVNTISPKIAKLIETEVRAIILESLRDLLSIINSRSLYN